MKIGKLIARVGNDQGPFSGSVVAQSLAVNDLLCIHFKCLCNQSVWGCAGKIKCFCCLMSMLVIYFLCSCSWYGTMQKKKKKKKKRGTDTDKMKIKWNLQFRRENFAWVQSKWLDRLFKWCWTVFVLCVQRPLGSLPVLEGDEEEQWENQLVPLLLPPFLEVPSWLFGCTFKMLACM